MGLLDKLLDFGATFDWITPAASLFDNDPGFSVPKACGPALAKQLRSQGIKLKHVQIIDGQYVFDVPKKDAARVRQLMNVPEQAVSVNYAVSS